jgi:hypothetical protein
LKYKVITNLKNNKGVIYLKFIFGVFSFVYNFIFRTFRFILIGAVTTLGLIYFINNLLDPSFGKTNIRLMFLLFSFLPLFSALFIEILFFLNKRSSKKNKLYKEVEHLKIK